MEGIIDIYKMFVGSEPDKLEEILRSVSTRRYFRLTKGAETLIGTYSPDRKETEAFITFSNNFTAKGINVPEILAVSDDRMFYLQSDLGDSRMHEIITSRSEAKLKQSEIDLYKAAIDQLIKIQIDGHKDLDYSVSVPRSDFDKQSILWDLNHFKYYFLKPSGLPFDEQNLEDSFASLADQLDALPRSNFMFRDFQSRNIMLKGGKAFLIDYQGGRRGALQYDIASLLFESKAALIEEDRDALFDYYLDSIASLKKIDQVKFRNDYYLLALIRILQVLGTYGLRGLVEKKVVFIQSIPGGLENLEYILNRISESSINPFFRNLLMTLAHRKNLYPKLPETFDGLTITIYSFSYRKPLPDDISGNGGGYVYDCRFLNNPGRQEKYKILTGFDSEVRKFLEEESEVPVFIKSVKEQLESVIRNYKKQNFSNLMVSFGCTGGRHRSVFMATTIAEWCRTIPGLRVLEIHRELGIKK